MRGIENNFIYECMDIKCIAECIKKDIGRVYEYVCNTFDYLPEIFSSENDVNQDPINAIKTINYDVDGTKGFQTNYTPERLIYVYKKCWRSTLKIEERKMLKRTKYKYYDASWRIGNNNNWGVSGDILFSFPKSVYSEIKDIGIDCYIKLFARLCYTVGNFIPVPKTGRGKKSVNSLHSYHRSFINGKQWERYDKFIYDVLFNEKSDFKIAYEQFEDYFSSDFIKQNFLECLVANGCIRDLVSLEAANKNGFTELDTKENIEAYIINMCASIIARGNNMRLYMRMLEE